MEGIPFSQEENEEKFTMFKEQIEEQASVYKEIIGSYMSESVLPEQFTDLQNKIDAEKFFCLTRVKDIQELAQQEFEKRFDDYRSKVDTLFEAPIQYMDAQLEATKIMLDDTPFDVWQNATDEFSQKLTMLEQDETLSPEAQGALKDLKESFQKSMEAIYTAKENQLQKLSDHYREYQLKQSSSESKAIAMETTEVMKEDEARIAHYNAQLYTLTDTYEHNCKELLEKAIELYKKEKNNLN